MKATELPSWAWRDPAEVAERLELMTCEGCMFRLVLVLGTPECVKHKGRVGERMWRCGDFIPEPKR